MAPKRTIDEVEDIQVIEGVRLPNNWIEKLTENPDIAVLLAHIAQEAGVTDREIKRSKLTLPSISKAKWGEIAPELGFPLDLRWVSFERFSPPMCFLPRSIHENMFQEGWRRMDVYQERTDQDREAVRVKLLEPWLVPILALFEGRVMDRPDSVMVHTQFSTGSEVEHEVMMKRGVLFLVIERKLGLDNDENLAQLFLELLSATQRKQSSGIGITRVYGLLTDLSSFKFYSYDPSSKSFFLDEDVLVNVRRDDFCSGMIYVSNKIFSVIMCGYIEILRATVEANTRKSKQGDQLTHTPSIRPAYSRASLSDWEKGLLLAEAAYTKLQEMPTDLENLENTASEGLKLLAESVRCLPRVSQSTSDRRTTVEGLKSVAAEGFKKWYEEFIRRSEE